GTATRILEKTDQFGYSWANLQKILSYTSIVISVIFLLELPPSLWAFGIDYYLPWSDVEHSTLHLLDAIIIIMNFAVLFIRGPAQDVFELLVLLRLWRMVKLLGGVASGVERLNIQLQERLEETEKELAATQQELNDCKRQLQMLQQSANRERRSRALSAKSAFWLVFHSDRSVCSSSVPLYEQRSSAIAR
ncbi:1977_t:CDS:2, partial [Acaulospora colombiana]